MNNSKKERLNAQKKQILKDKRKSVVESYVKFFPVKQQNSADSDQKQIATIISNNRMSIQEELSEERSIKIVDEHTKDNRGKSRRRDQSNDTQRMSSHDQASRNLAYNQLVKSGSEEQRKLTDNDMTPLGAGKIMDAEKNSVNSSPERGQEHQQSDSMSKMIDNNTILKSMRRAAFNVKQSKATTPVTETSQSSVNNVNLFDKLVEKVNNMQTSDP